MNDPRIDKLAELLVQHSTRVQAGERVLIETFDAPEEIALALIRAVRDAGGVPLVSLKCTRIHRELVRAGDRDTMEQIGEFEAHRMEQVQAYIAIRGTLNFAELSDVPTEAMQLYQKHWWNRVHTKIRVPRTKWVVLRWPTSSMAQQAKMSTEAFEDFYFAVCTLDYAKMQSAIDPLKARLEAADQVRLVGPGTDLRFSVKDIPVIPCSGRRNIPDGECFTAPVRDSVEGTIQFNTPALYHGTVFEGIRLVFKGGKIVEASANDSAKLNAILDTDEGSRHIGEFAIGFNPHINDPMQDTLFDEKIAGSFHFTPGQAYEEADNGNRSSVHWDMVMIQTPAYGGGEIYFDGELVRRDGVFVPEDLKGLNPENLTA